MRTKHAHKRMLTHAHTCTQVLRIKLEVKDHNLAEIDRVQALLGSQIEMYTTINEDICKDLNSEFLRQIEETKRDNILQMDMAREKYNKYYKRDLLHNENVACVLAQTAEIREQMVACRRFYNVIGRCLLQRSYDGISCSLVERLVCRDVGTVC